jgi:hypothetical protein
MLRSPLKANYISEEDVTSIFRIEKKAKQQINMKEATSRAIHLPKTCVYIGKWEGTARQLLISHWLTQRTE